MNRTPRNVAIGCFVLAALALPNCGQGAGPTLEHQTSATLDAPSGSDAAESGNVPVGAVRRVATIENLVSLAPGFVTLSGFVHQTAGTEPIVVAAWIDGIKSATVPAIDPHVSKMGDVTESGFVIDLAVTAGDHLVCAAPSMAGPDERDCAEFDVESVQVEAHDVPILLTGVTPTPTGAVDVRGVLPGSTGAAMSWITVSTEVGVITAYDTDEPVTHIEVIKRTFRLELQGLRDGTYLVCPGLSGLTVEIAEATADTARACGTVIVGMNSIGTTGRPIRIEAVGPPPDHPLYGIKRDGGVSVQLVDGSILWLFGDSSERAADGSLRYFINNTAAWASADAPTVTRDAVLPGTRPALFAEPPPGTCKTSKYSKAALWPESAVAIPQDDGTDRVVVFMSKVCLGTDWLDIENVGLAVVEVRYDPADPPIDRAIRGAVTQPDLWASSVGYGRALLLGPDGSLYGYWCGDFPDDWTSCRVARVAPDDETDPAAWRYWNGGKWTESDSWTSVESDAAAMELPDSKQYELPIAAFGVTYDGGFDAYLMVYSPWPGFGFRADVRVSDAPVGPWTEPIGIALPDCIGEIEGLVGHCYAVTPQMQLCDEGMFAGGYFDMVCDDDLARYFTFVTPFVVTHRET
jgi:hypothetical protein